MPVDSPEVQSNGPQDQDSIPPNETDDNPRNNFKSADGLRYFPDGRWHPNSIYTTDSNGPGPKDYFRGADGQWHYLTWHPHNATDGPADYSSPGNGRRHPSNIYATDGPADYSSPDNNSSVE